MNVFVGMSVAGLVGTNLVSRSTNLIVQKGVDTLSFFRSGSSSVENISAALRKIEELDIKIKIKVLQKFLNKYNPAKMSNKLYHSSENLAKSENLPLENLETTGDEVFSDICEDMDKIVDKCCAIIQKIEQSIADHGAKWLKRYRSFDVSADLTDLELYNTIMKNRIEMFMAERDDLAFNRSII
jgi:hypothetical protein